MKRDLGPTGLALEGCGGSRNGNAREGRDFARSRTRPGLGTNEVRSKWVFHIKCNVGSAEH